MKVAIALIATCIGVAALAEDAVLEKPALVTGASAATPNKIETNRIAKAVIEKPVTYGGFLTELGQAEKKSKFLSLRKPATPARDAQNLYGDERSGRSRGVVLFSIGF